MRSLEFSLERLGLDQVDIVFGHDVDVVTHGSKEAADARIKEFMTGGYRALDELRASGAIKAIGAGINEWDVAERLARAGDFDVFLLAGRYTLLEQEALTSFLPLCEEKKIAVVVGGPFNSGILATGPKADAHYNYGRAPDEVKERVSRIQHICKSFKVSLAEAALRFPLGHPCGRQRHRRRATRERSQAERRDDERQAACRAVASPEGGKTDARGCADAALSAGIRRRIRRGRRFRR